MDRDNGFAMAREQPARGAFPKEMPRLLLGLSAKMNLDRDAVENQLLSSDLIFLSNSSNAASLGMTSLFKRPHFIGRILRQARDAVSLREAG
jgi:hypothetical protein